MAQREMQENGMKQESIALKGDIAGNLQKIT